MAVISLKLPIKLGALGCLCLCLAGCQKPDKPDKPQVESAIHLSDRVHEQAQPLVDAYMSLGGQVRGSLYQHSVPSATTAGYSAQLRSLDQRLQQIKADTEKLPVAQATNALHGLDSEYLSRLQGLSEGIGQAIVVISSNRAEVNKTVVINQLEGQVGPLNSANQRREQERLRLLQDYQIRL
jgi:hypothetical protein